MSADYSFRPLASLLRGPRFASVAFILLSLLPIAAAACSMLMVFDRETTVVKCF